MTTEVPKEILTDDESSIIEFLQSIDFEEDDFDDPENGDFLDRMETLFRDANELDATVVKIAIDRVHFFLGEWTTSFFSGSESYEVNPETSDATDRLNAALESITVIESSGVKGQLLEIVDRLQVDYFWRDADNPNPELLRDLRELITTNRIKDSVLLEFVNDNILFPWNEFLGIQFTEVTEDSDYFEWYEQCKLMPGNQHAGVVLN